MLRDLVAILVVDLLDGALKLLAEVLRFLEDLLDRGVVDLEVGLRGSEVREGRRLLHANSHLHVRIWVDALLPIIRIFILRSRAIKSWRLSRLLLFSMSLLLFYNLSLSEEIFDSCIIWSLWYDSSSSVSSLIIACYSWISASLFLMWCSISRFLCLYSSFFNLFLSASYYIWESSRVVSCWSLSFCDCVTCRLFEVYEYNSWSFSRSSFSSWT